MIKEVVTYKLDGKEFKSLKEIKEYVENRIGSEIIDQFGDSIRLKDKLRVLEVLCKKENRGLIKELLSVTYEYHDCYSSDIDKDITRNILDL